MAQHSRVGHAHPTYETGLTDMLRALYDTLSKRSIKLKRSPLCPEGI